MNKKRNPLGSSFCFYVCHPDFSICHPERSGAVEGPAVVLLSFRRLPPESAVVFGL
jgi:hypothetical protein